MTRHFLPPGLKPSHSLTGQLQTGLRQDSSASSKRRAGSAISASWPPRNRPADQRASNGATHYVPTTPTHYAPTMCPPRPPPILLFSICNQWIWEMLPNQTKPGWALGRQRLTSELAAIPIQPKSKLTKNKPNPGVFHSMKAEQHASNSGELPCHPLCPPSPGHLFSSQFFFVSSLLAQ